jgi:hypothetical protein
LIGQLEDLAAEFAMGGYAERGLLMDEPVDYGETVVFDSNCGLAGRAVNGELETRENGGPLGFCRGCSVYGGDIAIRAATVGREEDVCRAR